MSANQVVAEVEAAKSSRRTANDGENMKAADLSPNPGTEKPDVVTIAMPQHKVDKPVSLKVINR